MMVGLSIRNFNFKSKTFQKVLILLILSTVIPRYNVDFGASQNSMLYQNLCYIEVYLKYKEKTRICKGNSLISLNEKIITCKTKCH